VSNRPQSANETATGTREAPSRATSRIDSTTRNLAVTTTAGETGISRSRSMESDRWFNCPVVIDSVNSKNSTGAIWKYGRSVTTAASSSTLKAMKPEITQ